MNDKNPSLHWTQTPEGRARMSAIMKSRAKSNGAIPHYKTKEYKNAKQRELRARKKHLPPVSSDSAVPCRLSECPHCHTRFYMIQGSGAL